MGTIIVGQEIEIKTINESLLLHQVHCAKNKMLGHFVIQTLPKVFLLIGRQIPR